MNPILQLLYTPVVLKFQSKQSKQTIYPLIKWILHYFWKSVFGFSKDEEVQTIYRHPVYEMELNKS